MRKTILSFLLCVVLTSSAIVAAQTNAISALSLATVTPNHFAGGVNMPVTITGSGLGTVTSVKLGATELSNVQISGDSQLTAQVPWSMLPGTYDLTVKDTLNLSATMTAAVTITTPATGWATNGPYGGNITDPSIDPRNSNRMYVSAERSGVYRTTDGAETWQMERLAFFPGKMHFVYVTGQITPVMYLDGSVGVNGLQRSLDNGVTWQQKMPDGYNTWNSGQIDFRIAVDDVAPDRVYLGLRGWNGVDPDMGLYISTDRGDSWTRPAATAGLHVPAVAVEPGNPNHVVIGTDDGKVLTSTNGGTTWSAPVLVDSPDPNDALSTIDRLVISPQVFGGHRKIWALSSDSAWVYFSIDDGASWHPVSVSGGSYNQDIQYHDTIPGLVWAAVGGGYYSTNDGATWTPLNAQIGKIRHFALVSGASTRTETTIYAGTDGGVFKSTDGGNSWIEKDYGMGGALAGRIEVSPFNADEAYAAVFGKGIVRSMDGGTHWQKLTIPNNNSGPGMAADPFIAGKFYFSYGGSSPQPVPEVYVTTDHGNTYATRSITLPVAYVNDGRWASVNAIVANTAVSGTLLAGLGLDNKHGDWAEGLIYASTNGGVTWVERTVPSTTNRIISMVYAPRDPNVVYAGTEAGLLVSVDGGVTWAVPAHQPNIERVQAVVVDPRNSQSVYLTGGTRCFCGSGEGGTYATHDGGATWERLDGMPDEGPVWALKFVAVGAQYWLYAANMRGLRFLRDVPATGFDRFTSWEKSNGIAGVADVESFNAATDGTRVVYYIGTSGGTVPTTLSTNNLRAVAATTQDLPGGVYRRQGAESAPAQINVPGWLLKNKAGFGNINNGISALEVFDGQIYVATSNWSGSGCRIWRSANGSDWTPASDYGMSATYGSTNPAVSDLVVFKDQLYASIAWGSNEGQIWRSNNGTTWSKVSGSEWSGNNIYVMTVYNNELYAASSGSNLEVWRSTTGDAGSWAPVAQGGFSNPHNKSVSGAGILSGTLYLAVRNDLDGMTVISKTAGSGWAQANVSGFGSNQNADSGGMAILGGYLYVGVKNTVTGAQVWRYNGTAWTRVVADGFGDVTNDKVDGLFVVQNQLYAVTENEITGLQVWRSVNGTTWSPLNVNGLGKKANYSGLWSNSSMVFGNTFYLGTMNFESGGEVWQYTGFPTYMPSIRR